MDTIILLGNQMWKFFGIVLSHGIYVMPEKGNTAQIVFHTKDENQAYEAQSVRKEDIDKTADPEVKYLYTPNGKETKPGKEEILITINDDVIYININEVSDVEIIMNKAVHFRDN